MVRDWCTLLCRAQPTVACILSADVGGQQTPSCMSRTDSALLLEEPAITVEFPVSLQPILHTLACRYPVDRLQMELSAMTGRSEPPHVVAEYSRLVQTTLNKIAPQFPDSSEG